jgi:uncharacterized protein (DUF362 family)
MLDFGEARPVRPIVHVARDGWTGAQPFVRGLLPEGNFRRITIKPNWVIHQTREEFPISALVTDSRLIQAVIEACLEKYSAIERIRVGDVPLQSCDWAVLRSQAGIDQLEARYRDDRRSMITFHDWRREKWRIIDGFLQLQSDEAGDELGYAELALDEGSLLDEVSDNAHRFRVSDYDPVETVSRHARGYHRYLIARSVLDADLFINLPKMKTHQKTGITGALKNLVGINGSKAYLVHHQKGRPSQGGDEFPEHSSRIVRLQTAVREQLQKRSRLLFNALKQPWELYKRVAGVATLGTRENLTGKMYVGSGSWYGNDSIWRMAYDLNLAVIFGCSSGGALSRERQRTVLSIVDGMVSGEGNGPLQPLPVNSGVLIGATNPFLVDLVMARLMGFDYHKIPLLANHRRFADATMADFDPEQIVIAVAECTYSGISSLPPLRSYVPPPGWREHIEIARTEVA